MIVFVFKLKTNESYEPINDVKNQLKFIEELDKIEKKKKDEAERDKLMKAAKSRTKGEDQELKNLKQKAKEVNLLGCLSFFFKNKLIKYLILFNNK
jgi:hypothetical protein